MSGKSDEGLMDYLNSFNKYTPEAITAAVDELKRRGRQFTEQELVEINDKIENRIKADKQEDSLWGNDSLKANIVTDSDAPLLYSKGAIRGFCVVFTTIFGAVLLSSNISDTKRKWTVIGFGVLYTALTMVIVNVVPINTFWVLLLNTAGGLGLTTTFWDKYVGNETKYRAKPIWKPLVISVVITIPFVFALFYAQPSDDPQSRSSEYCYLGLEKFKGEEFSEAIKLYSTAFEIDPSNTEAIYMRGLSKSRMGDSKGAISDYSILVKISPNDAEAFSLMADEKLNVQDSVGAFSDSERAIQIGSNDPDVYLRVGTIQMQLKKLENAIASFSKAIELNPSFGPAFYNRGIARYDLNQVEKACGDFKEAMRLGIPEAKTEVDEVCK